MYVGVCACVKFVACDKVKRISQTPYILVCHTSCHDTPDPFVSVCDFPLAIQLATVDDGWAGSEKYSIKYLRICE